MRPISTKNKNGFCRGSPTCPCGATPQHFMFTIPHSSSLDTGTFSDRLCGRCRRAAHCGRARVYAAFRSAGRADSFAGSGVAKLRAVAASGWPKAMDNILKAFELASMTTEQVIPPSNSCERCACPALPITVHSASAAHSRTQRDKGDLHLSPQNGGGGRQG